MEFPIKRYGLNFRLVVEDDAEFILDLRTDKKLARYISGTDDNLENQINWIKNYKKREAKGEEYYFIFEKPDGEKMGVVRLYDFKGDTYNCGSWLIKPDGDDFIAIKSDLFVSKFALDELKLERCFFDVKKNNKKVVRYHKMFSTKIKEDENTLYLMMDRSSFQLKYNYLIKILEPGI